MCTSSPVEHEDSEDRAQDSVSQLLTAAAAYTDYLGPISMHSPDDWRSMVFHFTHWVARQAEDIVSSQSVFRSWAKTVYLLNLLSMEPCYLPWSDIAPSAKMAKRFTELSQICGSGDEPDAEDEDAELSETYKAPIYYEEEPDESDGDDGPEIL